MVVAHSFVKRTSIRSLRDLFDIQVKQLKLPQPPVPVEILSALFKDTTSKLVGLFSNLSP